MACACSVFSLAMMVRLLISGLLFCFKSCKASLKSAATSADETDMLGKRDDQRQMLVRAWVS
jgi:hypothetical protein